MSPTHVAIPNANATISSPPGADASGIRALDTSPMTFAWIASSQETIKASSTKLVKVQAQDKRVTLRLPGFPASWSLDACRGGGVGSDPAKNARRTA